MNILLKSTFLFFLSFGLSAQTTVFNFTDAFDSYIIPAGTKMLRINAIGAQGGSHSDGATGGLGVSVTSIFPVGGANPLQEGQTLFIYVGGEGEADALAGGGAGGFNGGGTASTGNDANAIHRCVYRIKKLNQDGLRFYREGK